MVKFSTHQVAKRLGLDAATLSRYIKTEKILAPPETMAGGIKLRLWSETDIEGLKKTLPKIANGRKTRWQKLRKKQRKAQAKAPVPHKKKKK